VYLRREGEGDTQDGGRNGQGRWFHEVMTYDWMILDDLATHSKSTPPPWGAISGNIGRVCGNDREL